MIIAQSFGEYGGGNLLGQVASSVESGVQWVQLSVRANPDLWIGAAIALVLLAWLFRR